jgi:hypothetical protein
MEQVVELSSDCIIYVSSCMKIGSGVRNLMKGRTSQKYRQNRDYISPSFSQNKESRRPACKADNLTAICEPIV